MNRRVGRALKKFGAYTRRVAQRSMKAAKDGVYSRPGEPLHSHGDQRYKKNIVFAYEPQSRSVVIGPRLFPRTAAFMIPRLHEKGGRDARGTYEVRSVMVPAFQKSLPRFKTFFVEGSSDG